MAQPEIRWWESRFNLGFAGSVVATIVATWALAALDKLPDWVSTLGRAAIRPVSVPLILFVAILAVLGLLSVRALFQNLGPAPPPWLDYRSDTLLGIVWRWRYDGTQLDRHSLSPYCPQCSIGLRGQVEGYSEQSTAFICDECRFVQRIQGNGDHVLDRVCRLIEREVNLKYRRQP